MTFQLCQFVSVCVVHCLFWIVFTNFESASFHLPPCPLSWRILSSVCWCIRCFRDVEDQYDLYFCYLAPFLFFFFMLCRMCACVCLPTNLNSEVWQQDFRCIRMNKEGEHGNLRCVTWHIKVSMCLAGTLERGKSELFHLNLWVWFFFFFPGNVFLFHFIIQHLLQLWGLYLEVLLGKPTLCLSKIVDGLFLWF